MLDQRTRKRDNEEIVPQAACPQCGQWADVDGDQLRGSVSLICGECGWHGYIDGRAA